MPSHSWPCLRLSETFLCIFSKEGAPTTDPVWVALLSRGGSAEESKAIAVNDELLAVAGQNVYGMTLDDINNLIWYDILSAWRQRGPF